MAKQVYFFMDEYDQMAFINLIIDCGLLLIARKLDNERNYVELSKDSIQSDMKLYIYKQGFHMASTQMGYVDEDYAEVIIFETCPISDKLIKDGRICLFGDYYDKSYIKQRKSEELFRAFDILKKYIRKNYTISKDKLTYIGPHAFKKYKEGWKMGRIDYPTEF